MTTQEPRHDVRIAHEGHTDRDIAHDAVIALMRNPAIPSERLMVSVDHGCVTLTGSVESLVQREAAFRAIRDVADVRAVTDNVVVQPIARVS
jgi:osmotically-inducible protein OsmY